MKILFHTRYYPPEIGAAPTRTRELAGRLQQMGHEVTILTGFPNYPSGVVPKEWRGHAWLKQTEDGIQVCRVWSITASTKNFAKRAVGDISFAMSTVVGSLVVPKPDVVIVESHPLFGGNAGILIARLKGAPAVLNVSDLWPDSAIQLGKLKNPALIWLAKALEKSIYRRATLVLAMTSGIFDKIRSDGIPAEKLLLFRNAVDSELFKPELEAMDIRAKLGLNRDAFIVLYAGTLGSGNHVASIMETAVLFSRERNRQVHFVFAGDGGEKGTLQARVAEEGLSNVSFVDPVPKNTIPRMLNGANCVVVSLANQAFFNGYLPRKMFEAMACARPVVVAAMGEARELVNGANAGLCVTPESAQEIHDAVLQLYNNRVEAQAMGERGRKYIKDHFSTEHRARQLNDRLQVLSA